MRVADVHLGPLAHRGAGILTGASGQAFRTNKPTSFRDEARPEGGDDRVAHVGRERRTAVARPDAGRPLRGPPRLGRRARTDVGRDAAEDPSSEQALDAAKACARRSKEEMSTLCLHCGDREAQLGSGFLV